MSCPRILIIEDDTTLSSQVARLLEEKGFSIQQCLDGQKGLLCALQESFDLILLDVLLPSLNGFSVLNQIRRVKQTPIMMITACGAEQERIEGYRKGADDYLPKPFNFTEMMLWVLIENRNEIMSKAFLYHSVLDRPFSRYDRSLDMHLSRVRKKLVEAGMSPERLLTMHGKGYRFT